MPRRPTAIALLAALVIALGAVPAAAQDGNPFNGLPEPAPTVVPTPEPVESADDETGRDTLYVIAGVLLVAFVAIGTWIARDARRSLPKGLAGEDRLREQGPHRHERQAKARARAKGRQARAARKRSRRARR